MGYPLPATRNQYRGNCTGQGTNTLMPRKFSSHDGNYSRALRRQGASSTVDSKSLALIHSITGGLWNEANRFVLSVIDGTYLRSGLRPRLRFTDMGGNVGDESHRFTQGSQGGNVYVSCADDDQRNDTLPFA